MGNRSLQGHIRCPFRMWLTRAAILTAFNTPYSLEDLQGRMETHDSERVERVTAAWVGAVEVGTRVEARRMIR